MTLRHSQPSHKALAWHPAGPPRATRIGEMGGAGSDRLATAADFRLGPVRVRPSFREMTRDDGRREILEPRVMQVPVVLALADGIVGRGELVDRCSGGWVVGDDAINRIILRVRFLSEDIGAGVFGIETITKVGYRLIRFDGDVRTTPSTVASPNLAAPTRAPSSSRIDRRIAVGALAATGVGGLTFWRIRSAQTATSIAVMPFEPPARE